MISWPPKDWRALLALVFSVLGAVILTVFVWWGFAQLLPGGDDGWSIETEADRAQTLRWVLWIAVATIGAVLLGLGMAINRRSFRGNLGSSGFDFEGGDEGPQTPAQAAKQTAAAAEAKAEEIAATAKTDDPLGGA